ncbi:hypothetical protein [Acuticoccus sediminis]|uniref:hypothetical protein n=1 Tax=Acuticoccus sediminis TaxID=2184697 RepID=UPI0011B93C76|nr:hypothetical protein [Acuticoccus sediminis]
MSVLFDTDLSDEQIDAMIVSVETEYSRNGAAFRQAAKIIAARSQDWARRDFFLQEFTEQNVGACLFRARHRLLSGQKQEATTDICRLRMSLDYLKQEYLQVYIRTGQEVRHSGGGRPSGANDARDMAMAREFLAQYDPAGHRSASALKAQIGKRNDLKRSSAIKAIDRALKKLSGKRD